MNSLINLVKISFINEFNLNNLRKQGKTPEERKKSIRGLLLIISIGIMFIGLSSIYSFGLAQAYNSIGELQLLLISMIFACSLVTLITSLYKAPGVLFNFRDYDLLMALPINDKMILISKVITLLSLNYLASIIVLIPASINYCILAENVPMTFIPFLIVSIVMIPLLPVVISSAIVFGINYISSKVRFSKLLGTIGLFLVFILLIIGILMAQSKLGEILTQGTSIAEGYLKIYPPAYYLTTALTTGSIVDFIIFILISVIPFVLFVAILGRRYKGISSKLSETYRKNNYVLKSLKTNSPLKALIIKEIRKYFSTTIYVFNTFFGMIMAIIGGVAMFFISPNQLMELMQMPGIEDLLNVVPIIFLGFCISTTCTTNSSISLEGKNLWILKSLPVKVMDIFLSKIAVNLILTVPISLLVAMLFTIALKNSVVDFLLTAILVVLMAFIVSIGGLIINLLFPKLEWTSETVVVKQSMSSLLGIFLGFIILAMAIGGYFLTPNMNMQTYLMLVSIVLIIINFIFYKFLEKRGIKIFEKL